MVIRLARHADNAAATASAAAAAWQGAPGTGPRVNASNDAGRPQRRAAPRRAARHAKEKS